MEFVLRNGVRQCGVLSHILCCLYISTKEKCVYHRVWKQLVMMVVTSAWTDIVKRRCGLVVP